MTKYIALIVAAATLFSCEDFLDKRPLDQIAADVYFKDEASAQAATFGMYRSMTNVYYYGQSMIIIPEIAAGQAVNVNNYPEFVEFRENRIRPDNPWVGNIWITSYGIVNAANNVIANVPEIADLAEAKRRQFVNEAKFIRALVYFNLVRSWGEVPLLTEPTPANASVTDLRVSRTPVAQVYAQIIADLTDAKHDTLGLPDTYSTLEQTKGRATRKAAKALLSKVLLYRGTLNGDLNDLTNSANLAREVINANGPLMADFKAIWTTENTGESVFELQFDTQATNTLATVSNPTTSMLYFSRDSVYNAYEANDIRRNSTFNIQNDARRYYIGKYPNYNPAVQNFPVIRMGEIYLIYAEAQARVNNSAVGDPYLYYKQVRDRAGLTTPDETTFTKESFINAVQREKRLELMFEGEAWYDYTRTGLALTEMMAKKEAKYYLFPIPQAEREVNENLTQNDAY